MFNDVFPLGLVASSRWGGGGGGGVGLLNRGLTCYLP